MGICLMCGKPPKILQWPINQKNMFTNAELPILSLKNCAYLQLTPKFWKQIDSLSE